MYGQRGDDEDRAGDAVTPSLRIILGIIAALAGVIAGVIGNTLSINIVYLFNKRGRKPVSRPFVVWLIFFVSALLSVVFGSVAAFAPSSAVPTSTVEIIFTPTPEPPMPVRVEFQDRLLTVYNQQDEIFWEKPIEGKIIKAEIDDLDNDGLAEVVIGVAQNDQLVSEREDDTGKIVVFDHEGIVEWEVNFNDAPTYAINTGGKIGIIVVNNFLIADLFGDSKKEISVAVHDLQFYSSKLALLSSDGALGGEYWHPGFIYEMESVRDRDNNRTLLIVRAVNNDLAVTYNSNPSSVFALDPLNVRGQAPPYVYFQVENGTQLWYGLVSKPADMLELKKREMTNGPDIVVVKLNTGYFLYINPVTGEVINVLADNDNVQQTLPGYNLIP